MTMPARSVRRHADPDPAPIIDFGVPFMFDIQTELHLRRAGRDAAAAHETGRAARAILIAANLSALSLLAATLL
ncbi:hypothetical protein GIY56_07945 [Paracoccus sp. YIM 132242]|uniref:Uncharacterized protein n=1 Tax=Paracoccus lichenicola TaxID=2665644 RepID=A0A6L6HM10_9RHOB|nr:hypothetical protein [Paracoccus lichenicola]MTE00216.1 hypothetical protein [Paracoccus lichenicola]